MHENPSADRFVPPPAPCEPVMEGWAGTRVVRVLLVFGLFGLGQWLHTVKGSGWARGLAALGIFALTIGHYVFARKHPGRGDADDPYTPPTHVTR